MEYFGKLFSSVHTFYNELNPATLSGAIDIIVVEQQDGELSCSPFHVRFGKLSVLRPQEKKVVIKVNDETVPYVMKVGDAGEAFFIFETDHDVPEEYQTSPLLDASPNEATSSEDPPFLDIGQAKTKTQDSKTESSLATSGDSDDDEATDNRISFEPLSPKIIIEEQMDKVVTHLDRSYHTTNDMSLNSLNNKLTNMDLHQQPTNDTYPQTDGSTVLERTISEPISSTTVTKESFTIRPLDGKLDSIWMAVVRNIDSSDLHQDNKQHDDYDDHKGIDGDVASANNPTNGDSIFLDISGYKTEDENIPGKCMNPPTLATESTKTTTSSQENTKQGGFISQEKPPGFTSWGWGQSYKGDGGGGDSTDQQQQQQQQQTNGNGLDDDNNISKPSDEILVQPGHIYNIQLSLCGFSAFGSDEAQNASVFRQHQITFGNFVQNPNILNNKSLVFKHNDRYYATGCSGPFFTSLLIYQKPMTGIPHYGDVEGSDAVQTSGNYRFGRGWRQWFSRSSVKATNANTSEDATTPMDGNTDNKDDHLQQHETSAADKNVLHNNIHHTTFTTSTKATTFGLKSNNDWQEGDDQLDVVEEGLVNDSTIFPKRRNFAKTLRLTSEQLKTLPLKKGVNTISFSVTSSYQGTATCVAKLFLWDAGIKVVVSDIDGTITKSDALGHVFTMIGKDWTHNGVAKLYTDVHHNGYQFLYLTSRAIGQADYTRDYLKGVIQDDYQLPDGPVLMSPDRLFTSFHREVIIRKPEMFKMGCLRDVLRLFGNRNPFYAGFGNRITDGVSYRSVDVPTSRIFTIDPHGEVKLELLLGFKSSYVDLNGLVDQMFPPLDSERVVEDQSFNDWNFWKTPLPEIDLPLPDMESSTPSAVSPTMRAFDNKKAGVLSSPTAATSSSSSSSSAFTNNHVSPKPKPIVPDISTLPKESVIDLPTPSRRKRSILRRLTSRSSLNSNSSSPSSSASSSSTLSSSLVPPKMNHNNILLKNSQSTPTTTATVPAKTKISPPVKDLFFELLDDDTFDATLDALEDEIDMDSIPFI